jgi:hypothetical protein
MVDRRSVSSFYKANERRLLIIEIYVSLYVSYETFYLQYYKYDSDVQR